jgi:hypothetical protein
LFSPCGARWSLWNEKRKESSTEILVAFAIIALVAAILIVYFDTAHKLKLLAERIESIEMSGRRPNNRVLREISPTNETCQSVRCAVPRFGEGAVAAKSKATSEAGNSHLPPRATFGFGRVMTKLQNIQIS